MYKQLSAFVKGIQICKWFKSRGITTNSLLMWIHMRMLSAGETHAGTRRHKWKRI